MKVRTRFWLEAILAALSTGFFILTLLSRNWIEIVFGVDPDNSSGSLEWLIVAALGRFHRLRGDGSGGMAPSAGIHQLAHRAGTSIQAGWSLPRIASK